MAGFLTDEWFAAVHGDGVELADVTVAVTVVGAPGGDVTWHARVTGGTVSAAPGAVAGADVELTLPYDESVAVLRGELDPSVAFMRGRMKTAGDPGRLLDVLAAMSGPGFRAARERLAAATDV
jgi:hypothetical protein